MQEFFRFVEQPRRCSYLPRERASLEIRCISRMTTNEYADLLARGYRRFGMQVFRPACQGCSKCRSVRIPVQDFVPSGSERRVLRKNAGIRAELHPLSVTSQHIDLYNRYHRFMHGHRGWPLRGTDASTYTQEFLLGASNSGRQWLYFNANKLVGVSLMDIVPGAISLVYFFYDPEWRDLSPGKFSILNQVLYAKTAGIEYAYLGYWIEECQSMQYKGSFHPLEVLSEYPEDDEQPVWTSVEKREELP